MKRLPTMLLILTLAGSPLAAQTYISSTSIDSDARQEGLIIPKDTSPFLIDNWTAATSAPMLASPKMADLTSGGVPEIITTTYGIVNPYGEGWIHAWDGEGNEMANFPIHVTGAAPGTPAVADLNNDGLTEIVQGTWTYLYVFDENGQTEPGWPIPLYITQAATLADLDEDGDLEIIVPSGTQMTVYHHDASSYPGFPVTVSHDLTAAAIGDIDGDFDPEIVAGSFVASGSPTDYVYAWEADGSVVPGFPVTTAGSVKVPPAIADLDGDGTAEIIADCWSQSATDQLYVWDHQGNLEPGWPQSVAYCRLSSPSVADLDNDGDLEIVVGGLSMVPSGEKIYAYHHDGSTVAGFPVVLDNTGAGNINSSLVMGDIDGDGFKEIVIKAANNVFALNHNGSVVSGFPVPLDDESHSGTTSPTPVLGDPDDDGLVEIFAAACYNNVILIDMNGGYSAAEMSWPTYQFDACNIGAYKEYSIPSVSATIGPIGGPIVIPAAGGSFEYWVEVYNWESSPVSCDVWISAGLPGGGWTPPLLAVYDFTFMGGAGSYVEGSQVVPARGPAGTWLYAIRAGQYPDEVWTYDAFSFEKLGSGTDEIDLSEWTCIMTPFETIDTNNTTIADETEVECHPNPFNPTTVISYQLPVSGRVGLSVYDLSGRKVVTLIDGYREAGLHQLTFDGSNLSSGIYFYRMSASDMNQTGKLLLVK